MKKIIIIVLLLFPLVTFAKEEVKFSACVDGDTIKVVINDEIKTVRLLAVDTPESVHPTKEVEPYGKEASLYTCNLITSAKKIELEYDNNSDKTDKYGRVLAWVFVDDYLLEDILVSNGYAEVTYLYGDYKYTNILKDHEELAKASKLNIWSETTTTTGKSEDNKDEDANIWLVIPIIIFSITYPYLKKKLKKVVKKSKIIKS